MPVPEFGLLQAADVLSFFKVQIEFITVPQHLHVHIFGAVLGGAGAQTVKSKGELIVSAGVVFVLSARVHLAVHQFPVKALLPLVILHRTAAAEILHFNGMVQIPGDIDEITESLSRLVNGIGKDFKHRMFTALYPVGTKDDSRTFPDPVRALQGRNTGIIVCACRHLPTSKSKYQYIAENPHGKIILSGF